MYLEAVLFCAWMMKIGRFSVNAPMGYYLIFCLFPTGIRPKLIEIYHSKEIIDTFFCGPKYFRMWRGWTLFGDPIHCLPPWQNDCPRKSATGSVSGRDDLKPASVKYKCIPRSVHSMYSMQLYGKDNSVVWTAACRNITCTSTDRNNYNFLTVKTRIPHVILGRDCLVVWVYGGGLEMSMIVLSHAHSDNPCFGWVTLSTLW